MSLHRTLLFSAFAIVSLWSEQSCAQTKDWFFRVGVHAVNPKSDNGTLAGGTLKASIDQDVRPTLILGRFLNPNWAVELLASFPYQHTASLNGVEALEFKHLPPTLTLQYHFAPDAQVQPFIGAGLNYTLTFSEAERGPLAGTESKVGNSFGAAVQAGLIFKTNAGFDVTADVRWVDIDAKIQVGGVSVGNVAVDPLVYGLYMGWHF